MSQVFNQGVAADLVMTGDKDGKALAGVRQAVFAGEKERVELRPPPLFGEHTEEVVKEILGPEKAARRYGGWLAAGAVVQRE